MIVNTPSFGEIFLTNFTNLSYEDKIRVLEMRNHPKVRAQMYNQDIIDQSNHITFIDSLKDNSNKQYFTVEYQQSVVGVIYFTDIDQTDLSAVFGVYANLYEKVSRAGSILMESALTYFKDKTDLQKVSLEVYKSNEIAMNLYIKFDFVADNQFSKDGDEVISMVLDRNNFKY